MVKGKLIALEGPLFSGKTTILSNPILHTDNYVIIDFPFPITYHGILVTIPLGELGTFNKLEQNSSMLVAIAWMLEITKKKINPALLEGKTVIVNNWINSVIALLCYPFGKRGDIITDLCTKLEVATPTSTLIFSCSFDKLNKRYKTFIPNYSKEMKLILTHAYDYYYSCPGILIDANNSIKELTEDIVKIIQFI